MPANAPPSVNPADQDNLGGVFNTALRKFLQGVDDMLPARVVSYDRASNRAVVQPIVAMLTTAGAQVDRAQVASAPVFRYGGGGMVLAFNLQPGDLGWLHANDRDISLFLQSYANGAPNTRRMHSFEDGMFFPDAMRNVTIAGEDVSAVVLQTADGTQKVSISSSRVKLASGANNITIDGTGIHLTGPLFINGVPYLAHAHSNVTHGTDISGGVV